MFQKSFRTIPSARKAMCRQQLRNRQNAVVKNKEYHKLSKHITLISDAGNDVNENKKNSNPYIETMKQSYQIYEIQCEMHRQIGIAQKHSVMQNNMINAM